MRFDGRWLFAFSVAALLQAPLTTAATLPDSVAACAEEQEAAARLACYDKQNPPRSATKASTTSAPDAGVGRATSREGDNAKAAPGAADAKANSSAASAATPVASLRTQEADFGLSEELLRKKQANESGTVPQEMKRLTAHVTKVSARPHGELLLVLDNGQTWTQTEYRAGTTVQPGDAVTISKGQLGAFYLTSESRVSMRVKRLD